MNVVVHEIIKQFFIDLVALIQRRKGLLHENVVKAWCPLAGAQACGG